MRHHGISGPRAFLPRPELSSLEDVFGEVLAQKEKKLKKERKVRLDKSSARSSGVGDVLSQVWLVLLLYVRSGQLQDTLRLPGDALFGQCL